MMLWQPSLQRHRTSHAQTWKALRIVKVVEPYSHNTPAELY
jgi:hypothetical protein